MKLFQDLMTGEDMLSDNFDYKEVAGTVYEANCTFIKGDDVNVSTDGEDREDGNALINNIVSYGGLHQVVLYKKEYMDRFQRYLTDVGQKLTELGKDADYVKEFQQSARKYARNVILPNFGNFDLYTCPSENPSGMIALLGFREDDTPYFTFWKHGLSETET